MKCPYCQYENRTNANFCGECGKRIERTCPACGKSSPSGSRFCDHCGHGYVIDVDRTPAKTLATDDKLDRIQRYLPKGIAEKILAQKHRIEGERKQVTVLFCDMVGYSTLAEAAGPEKVYSIMDQVYEILIHKVHDYEGTVNELTGDGVMALFGAPIALEEAPQRAIRAGMAIHREMARFSDRMKNGEEAIPSLKMRVGINTGPVVVGSLGNDLRVEFKAVGDTVNLASRMERLAAPGTTYVTEETYKLSEGFFRFEALGKKKIKGRKKPVNVYQVIAPSGPRTRFDVAAERGLTPFVGRDLELALLLNGFERAREGRGQAFSIVSEAGLGKSRLLYEFRKAVSNENVTFLEGKCLSYSRGVAYYPITDILKSIFHIRETDDHEEIKEKVGNRLQAMGADEALTLPAVLELLSIRARGVPAVPMSTVAKRYRIMEALKHIMLRWSEPRPLILAIEDIQWIDNSSEECLRDLMEFISGARVLMIFTCRPEFLLHWGHKSYQNQVNLGRLSGQDATAMIAHLLREGDIDAALKKMIVDKTEGVPFFIEEFIRSLRDLKIIEQRENTYRMVKDETDFIAPSTIHDVIMARVDSLQEKTKDLLQTCSVIEREFSFELLKHVTDAEEQELKQHLSLLTASELLLQRGVHPHSTYIFNHALTREVVYDSILNKRKRWLHEKIGNSIEELHGKNREPYYGVLAKHFIESRSFEKAAEYSRLAALKAVSTASLLDAIEHSKNRIRSVEKLPQSIEVQSEMIDAYTVLGLNLFLMTYISDARNAVEHIIEEAEKLQKKERLSQIYVIMGTYYSMVEEDFSKAIRNLEKALQLSGETKDALSLFFANYFLGLALSWQCDFERAESHMDKAIRISEAINYRWATSVIQGSQSIYTYTFRGKIDLGYKISQSAVKLAEESGDIHSKSIASTSQGISHFYKGMFEEAENHLLIGTDSSEKAKLYSYAAVAHQWLGNVYFEMQRFKESRVHYCKAIYFRDISKLFPSSASLNKLCLARIHALSGRKNLKLDALSKYIHANRVNVYYGPMARCMGEVLMNLDDFDSHMAEASRWIQKAEEADRRHGMIWDLGRDHAVCARLLKKKGNLAKAKARLNKAVEIFRGCGADEWVGKINTEFSQC